MDDHLALEFSQIINQSRATTVESPEINQSEVVDCCDAIGSDSIWPENLCR